MQSVARGELQGVELAKAHVRASSMLGRAHPHLRKIAALIHRDDAVGIIAQRILSGDSKTTDIVNAVIAAMWLDSNEKPSVSGAIDLFGWSIVREVAIAAMLHQIHVELAVEANINPVDLDRHALSVMTAAVQFGADPFAAILANVGIAGLAGLGGTRYTRVRHHACTHSEDLSFLERNEFGFDHATLGAAMLWEADVPDRVCVQVQGHSATGTPIWLAEVLAAEIGMDTGLSRSQPKIGAELFARYNLGEAKLERIKEWMTSSAGLPEFYFALDNKALVA